MIRSQKSLDPSNNYFEGSVLVEDIVITREFIKNPKTNTHIYTMSVLKSDKILKPTILFVHGFGDHTGRYYDFSIELAKQGFDFYAYDCRGFGYSSGIKSSATLKEYFEDLIFIIDYLKSDDDKPLYLYGYSTGGGVLISFIKMNPHLKISGLILCNPFVEFHPRAKANIVKKTSFRLISSILPVIFIYLNL